MTNIVSDCPRKQSTIDKSGFLTDLDQENLSTSEVIVFIDSQVEDYQSLVNHLVPEVNVFVIDSQEDGVIAIANILQSYRDRAVTVHLVSHGSPGSLQLGNTQLSLDNLEDYASCLSTWTNKFASSSLFLYGCNVAAGNLGIEFIRRLHQLTGVNIAASAKPTGSSHLGGNWNLEINIGEVVTAEVFAPEIREAYNFVLGVDDTEIDIWYGNNQQFGNIGIPQTWINILGNVFDPDGISSLTYSLNGDPVIPLTIGRDGARLENIGDFNVDIAFSDLDSSPVEDLVTINVEDSLGNISTKTVTVDYESGNVWPENYSVNWSSVLDIQDVAQVVDGKWAIEGDRIRTIEPGYDRLVAIGDTSWTDYEVTVPITPINLSNSGGGVGILMRWNGHTDLPSTVAGRQPKTGFLPFGAIGWFRGDKLQIHGNGVSCSGGRCTNATNNKMLQEGITYNFKMRVETIKGVGGFYSLKVWEVGNPEPTEWDVQRQEDLIDPQNGSMMLIAHRYDVSFGDVTITPLTGVPPSNQQPTANDDSATVAPGNTVEIDVLSNDTDSDGTLVPGSLSVTTQPSNGTINIDSNGIISYTHDGSTTTTDSFSYTVEDDDGATSNVANVDLTITEPAPNQAPTANDDSATVAPGNTVEIDVLSNDTDSDGNLVPGSLIITTQPSNGTINVDGNGIVSYTHDGSTTTTDSFSYTVEDDDGATSNIATVDLTITEPPSGSLFESDDFNSASLDSRWTIIDPLGDSTTGVTGFGTGDALLELSVPGGTVHDLWRSNKDAIRAMQSTTDSDFQLEVKYASEPDQRYEIQGILVEQDADDWIRFDTYHDGSRLRVFAATTTNGSSQARINGRVSPGDTKYLRVNRQGDVWSLEYSGDGSSWTTAGSFTYDLEVTQVGTFAGNAGSAPAFTSEVDYFFNTADPIVPEDGGGEPPSNQAPTVNNDSASVALGNTVEIDVLSNDSDSDGILAPGSLIITTQPSNGTVNVDNNGVVSYTHDGSTTATDSFAYTVEDNDGATSNIATVDLTITEPAENQAPVANNDIASLVSGSTIDIDVLANDTDSDGTIVPDSLIVTTQPSNGTVNADNNGIVSYTHDGSTTTTDSFSYTVEDNDGAISNIATVELTISEQPPDSIFESDDFNSATLDARWTVVDPLGDGTSSVTGFGTGDAFLELSVPGGTAHDLWRSNKDAIRAMQSTTDSDFQLEVKYASEPDQRYEIQGLLVEQDADDWIRFDTYHNGSRLQVFAATTTNGSSQSRINRRVSPGDTKYLRVNRQGDVWSLQYSGDGSSWTTAGSFTYDLDVTQVGTFAGNAGASPAFTSEVDYFFNTTAPIVPEV